jgi:hypothetical protein
MPTEIDVPTTSHPANEQWFEVPWAQAADEDVRAVDGTQYVVIAFDNRGVAAAASFLRAREGVAFDAMELTAPRTASPVLRGVTRVAPGERLAAPASLAVYVEGGRPSTIVASPSKLRLNAADLTAPELRIRRDAAARRVIPERR